MCYFMSYMTHAHLQNCVRFFINTVTCTQKTTMPSYRYHTYNVHNYISYKSYTKQGKHNNNSKGGVFPVKCIVVFIMTRCTKVVVACHITYCCESFLCTSILIYIKLGSCVYFLLQMLSDFQTTCLEVLKISTKTKFR